MATPAQNRRGIVYMLAAMALFVGNDTLMKLGREVFPTGQAIAIRTIFATLTGLAFVLILREQSKLLTGLRPMVLARGVVEATVAASFIWALGHLPLGNITAIIMASPLLIVVFAVVLRIERVGWRRSLAVAVGFIGVLIVVRPDAAGFNAAALIALASSVLVAIRDLMTRSIGNEVPATVISLTTTLVAGLLSLSGLFVENWVSPWRFETIYLAMAAVFVASGSFFIVNAFRNTDVGVISGYRYAVVIFAVLVGWLVWGDVPDPVAFAGMGLIVASGLYTMHRQRVRKDSNLRIETAPPR